MSSKMGPEDAMELVGAEWNDDKTRTPFICSNHQRKAVLGTLRLAFTALFRGTST